MPLQKSVYFLLFLLLALAASMPMVYIHLYLSWHDQQRAIQIVLIGLSTLFMTIRVDRLYDIERIIFWSILYILASGLISATFSAHPLWALTEVALFAGCLGLTFASIHLRSSLPHSDTWLLLAASCLCLSIIVKFCVSYYAAITNHEIGFYTYEMLDGFSNRRFFGQVATLLLPIMLSAMYFSNGSWPRRFATALWVLAAWVWFIVIGTGTRGTWLALAISTVFVFAIGGKQGRKLSMAIATSALAGLALSHLLLTVVPTHLGILVSGHPSERLTTSLSGREVIWSMSIDMIKENPLLGVGPMHFAAAHNPVAAHPHNALLQLAAEWGIPATLLILFLVGRAAWYLIAVIRQQAHIDSPENGLRVALFAALVGAAVQSMVDGVIVMPTTMVWLAIIMGWAWALQPRTPSNDLAHNTSYTKPKKELTLVKHWLLCFPFFLSAIWLIGVAIRDIPILVQNLDIQTSEQIILHDLKPRFWLRGFIN